MVHVKKLCLIDFLRCGAALCCTGLLIILSVLAYRRIERPAQRAIRRYVLPQPAATI